jgi:NADH dehydrogenase
MVPAASTDRDRNYMADVLQCEADHPRMGDDPTPETPASHGGEHREAASLPRIVVVGGGAGGLELVTRLGNRLGGRGRASITLVERARTHIWKPQCNRLRQAASIQAPTR